MASVIEISTIAANVCARCRRHKQRCDRVLPSCSRCALKFTRCDYAPSFSHEQNHLQVVRRIEPMVVVLGPRGFSDLSSYGEGELLKLIPDCTIDVHTCLLRFTKLVHCILRESNTTISGVIDRFSVSVHRWYPVVNLTQLREDAREPSTANPPTLLLLLAMLLFGTLRDRHYEDDSRRRRLYTTLKKLVQVLTSQSGAPDSSLIQVQALVALYECGQGMTHQAQLTLSSALAMVSMVDFEEPDILISRKISLVTLDRIIMLSDVNNNIASLCTLTCPISKSIQSHIQKYADTASASLGTSYSQQLYTTARVALATGRALHYVYCVESGYEADESYTSIETDMQDLAKFLIESDEGHSWVFCDVIGLTLCCLLMLHRTRVKEVGFVPNSRDGLAYKTSCRMIWDTCKISVNTIKNVDISQVSFIGMFCQLRAVYSSIDITGEHIPCEDKEGTLLTMGRFFQRWTIGAKFLKEIQAVVSSPGGSNGTEIV
ncbi:hypothetical protein F5884DRAFT_268040 [Xylogone sp. PMI_703]|nr:hypothetical protein F5884DRAFT_268040 [Xylogone sp. PMI_703]